MSFFQQRLTGFRVYRYLLLIGGLTGITVLYFLESDRIPIYMPCLIYKFTGLYCPGCGVTRAVHYLLHGQIGRAFGLNPLFTTLLFAFLLWTLIQGIGRLAGVNLLPRLKIGSGFFWGMIGVVILFGMLRNIPYYPFTLLAP